MTKDSEYKQLVRDNQTMRMEDIGAVVAMANNEDPEAIKSLMGLFVYKVERDKTPPRELLNWTAKLLLKYMADEKTDFISFAHPGKRGRRKLNSIDRQDRLKINNYIRENSSPENHGSVTLAIEAEFEKDGFAGAMEKFGISLRTAYKILEQYSGDVEL